MNFFSRKKKAPEADASTTQHFGGWTSLQEVGGKEPPKQAVVIEESVNREIEKYCHLDLKNEVGGVLIGRQSAEGPIEVLGAVEAKFAEHKAASLTFTHESWDYIHQMIEKNYKDLKIVGWFHTHPGYGIFLSNYDLFIHHNFFKQSYQVALVVDPCQNQRGVFTWMQEKLEKQSCYYSGKLESETIVPLTLELEEKSDV